MITAVDTNVLLDLFLSDSPFHSQSRDRLAAAYSGGATIICDVVYAELAPRFPDRASLDAALGDLHIRLSPVDTATAYEAGLRWGRYRRAGGPRERILPDFLIGAHALENADTLLTRDRGFYETYFPEFAKA